MELFAALRIFVVMEYALYFVILGAGLLMVDRAIGRALDIWDSRTENLHQRAIARLQVENNRMIFESQVAISKDNTEQQRIALRREELNTLKSED